MNGVASNIEHGRLRPRVMTSVPPASLMTVVKGKYLFGRI